MQAAAHAKINVNLRVLDRRPDGFHHIETLMAPLDLCDTVAVAKSARIEVSCDMPGVPEGPGNLAAKAASAFFAATGLPGGAAIRIAKQCPAGAGLGGGSSNAATTLVLLDRLFDTSLGASRLASLAAGIGSDCAWFLARHAAVCRGRGEIVGPPVDFPPSPILLLKPPFGVPTPWAYATLAARRAAGDSRAAETINLPWATVFNDFEPPVFAKYPLLGVLKAWLLPQPGVLAAGLSGSGSTLFALLDHERRAHPLSHAARTHFGPTLWTCQTFVRATPPPQQPLPHA